MTSTRPLAPASTLTEEFDLQVQALLDAGYPELSGLDAGAFTDLVSPLRRLLEDQEAPSPADDTVLPMLLVVTSALVPTSAALRQWQVHGKAGWTDMEAELGRYRPIPEVTVPAGPAYLLLDVRSGRDSLGVPPSAAQDPILAAGRTPLTIDEGVAMVTLRPEVFASHHAFQALGSRATEPPLANRVPSFWISKGAPRLGWCWWNNPHSWLGSASAARRLGG